MITIVVLFLEHSRQFHQQNEIVKLSMFLLTKINSVRQE